MSKIAIIGDTHFGSRGDIVVLRDHIVDYLRNEFFPYIDKNNIKQLLHLGDLFDRRKYINFNTLDTFRTEFLEPLKERGISMHIIYGNHDVVYKNTNRLSSLDLLLHNYTNISIIREPTTLDLFGKKIGMVPWINEENYDVAIDYIENNGDAVDLLCGHFEIKNFEFMSGVRSQTGLSATIFEDYTWVISGHFHTPSEAGNIIYPGSPYEFTWADYGQEKGFTIYDTKTEKLTKIPTKSRMFHKVYYDDSDEMILKKLKSRFKELHRKYVKVVVREKNNKKKFDNFIADLYTYKPHDVSIVESDNAFQLSQDEINLEAKTTMEIIDNTIENMVLDVNETDLKKLFHELYQESLDLENDSE